MNVRMLFACAPLALLLATRAGATTNDISNDMSSESAVTDDAKTPDAGAPDVQCIRAWPEARMRAYGYDHVVHVQNACIKDAVCSIATDVNPDAVIVRVPKGAEVETVTWLGSPAREFIPKVKCTLQ